MSDQTEPAEPAVAPELGTIANGTGTPAVPRYTVADAAAILGISDRGVRKRIAAGTLAAERIGGSWSITLDAGTGGTGTAERNPEPSTEPAPERESGRNRNSSSDMLRAAYQKDARIAVLEAELAAAREELLLRRNEVEELRDTLQEQATAFGSAIAALTQGSVIDALPAESKRPDAAVTHFQPRYGADTPSVSDSILQGPSSPPWWALRARLRQSRNR